MRSIILMIYIFAVVTASAQENAMTEERAVAFALKNSAVVHAAQYEVEAARQIRKTSVDLPKTEVVAMFGQYNSYSTDDNNITISQTIPFTAFGSQASLNRSMVAASTLKKSVAENTLVYQVRQVCQQLSFAYARNQLLLQQDSILEGVYKSASARYESGEARILEQTAADAQRNESKNRIRLNTAQIMRLRHQLKALLNSDFLPDLSSKELIELRNENPMDTSLLATNPSLNFSRQQIELSESQTKLERAKFAPDLMVGYFNQTLIGSLDPETGNLSDKSDRFSGFQVGVAVPLWFGPHQGRVKAASFRQKQSESEFEAEHRNLTSQLEQAFQQLDASGNSLHYYRTSALPNADRILKHAVLGFREGDIDYAEYLLSMQGAMRIREGYLQALYDYNQSIIYIEFLSGNKSIK